MRLAEPKTEDFLSFKKSVLGKGCGEKEGFDLNGLGLVFSPIICYPFPCGLWLFIELSTAPILLIFEVKYIIWEQVVLAPFCVILFIPYTSDL